MKKRRILFFHHAPHIGGASKSGLNILKAIPPNKYDIVIYCYSVGGPMYRIFKEAGFAVISAGNSPVSFLHYSGDELFALSPRAVLNYFRILFDIKKIQKAIEEIEPDVVIVNSMSLFWIGKIAKKAGKETICFYRETSIKGLLGLRSKMIKRYLNLYYDKIAFISKYDMERNKDLNCHIYLIYNTFQFIENNNSSKDDARTVLGLKDFYNILYVGGMYKLKGADVLLKAIPYILLKNAKLIFIGYDWNGEKKKFLDCKTLRERIRYILGVDYEKKCINIILKNKLKEKIKFFPQQEDLSPFYKSSDIMVFPSTRPHQGRPIFEAGFYKVPVIITDFQNLREHINDESGFIFKNRNSKQLAEIINNISENPDIVKPKVIKNYLNTIDKHSLRSFNEKIVKLLECS